MNIACKYNSPMDWPSKEHLTTKKFISRVHAYKLFSKTLCGVSVKVGGGGGGGGMCGVRNRQRTVLDFLTTNAPVFFLPFVLLSVCCCCFWGGWVGRGGEKCQPGRISSPFPTEMY